MNQSLHSVAELLRTEGNVRWPRSSGIQVIGWNQGEVFIEYPTKIINRVTTGQREVKWVPTAAATRIRCADSIWASTENDHTWRAEQGKRIDYRADPWTVYGQEHMGGL